MKLFKIEKEKINQNSIYLKIYLFINYLSFIFYIYANYIRVSIEIKRDILITVKSQKPIV